MNGYDKAKQYREELDKLTEVLLTKEAEELLFGKVDENNQK